MNNNYEELKKILFLIMKKEISPEEVDDLLVHKVDCVEIYSSDDTLLTDLYFTIKHFALGEEEITEKELEYFKECIDGKRKHSFEDMDEFIRKWRSFGLGKEPIKGSKNGGIGYYQI